MILKNLESNVNTLVQENELNYHIVNSLAELNIEDLAHCDAVIFRSDKIQYIKTEIERIRRADAPAIYLKPIFVSSKRVMTRLSNEVDGVIQASDLDTINEVVKEFVTRISKINPQSLSKDIAFSERVLLKTMQYMYTRQTALVPERNRASLMGYNYPFMRMLIPDFEVPTILDKFYAATEKDWFNSKIKDKVNLCKSCSGSYLHFVETCHRCNSIDIEAEHLIHHFRCAYIGPESDFKHDEIMMCPKCDKVLRHIGVDYDKPSEILSCNSCNHQAQQSSILANCIDCGETNELTKLHTKPVVSLELTTEGEDVAIAANAFTLVQEDVPMKMHEYELESQVFDLVRKQEISKTLSSKLKSYCCTIDFNSAILDDLSQAQKVIFINEFKEIVGNYLDDIDLMTMRSISEYDILLSCKAQDYAEDMMATLKYNINKILNDNFNDPDHQLQVTCQVLDKSFSE